MFAIGCAAVVVAVALRFAPRASPRSVGHRKHHRQRSAIVRWAALVVLGAALFGPLTAAFAATVLALLLRAQRTIRAPRRRRQMIERDFPLALDLLVTSLHGGATPVQAIAEVTDYLPEHLASAFRTVATCSARGMRSDVAVRQLSELLGPVAHPLVDALITAEAYGLALAPVLDQLAAEARATRRRQAEARARELPVRLSVPLVVCTLTSFVLTTVVPLLLGALSSLR
jgi:tight adherence protein C